MAITKWPGNAAVTRSECGVATLDSSPVRMSTPLKHPHTRARRAALTGTHMHATFSTRIGETSETLVGSRAQEEQDVALVPRNVAGG